MRTDRWRYTERNDGSTELYDHKAEPSEYFNVVELPEHSAAVKLLQSMLENEFGPRPDPALAKAKARNRKAKAKGKLDR